MKELNLDGCRKITDKALKYLVSKFLNPNRKKESIDSLNKDSKEIQENELLNSIRSVDIAGELNLGKKVSIIDQEEVQENSPFEYENIQNQFFNKKSLSGGARALIKITLSECKLITDKGVKRIAKLASLKFLSLSGCHYVTDKSACYVLKKCKNLEAIDLSGTSITTTTTDFIYSDCPNLKKLGIRGCGISGVYLKAFDNREIEIEYGDGLCRFYLFSEKENEIPNISKHFFETRSDLSIHRLKLFVKERLKSVNTNKEVEIEVLALYLCNNSYSLINV